MKGYAWYTPPQSQLHASLSPVPGLPLKRLTASSRLDALAKGYGHQQ